MLCWFMFFRRIGTLLVALAAAAGCAPHAMAVAGGHIASAGELPYILSLQRSGVAGWTHICGAVLVDSDTAITAAHCVEGSAFGVRVHYGSLEREEGGDTVSVVSIKRHENYSPVTNSHDIAIVELAFTVPAVPARLAAMGSSPAPGAVAEVAGWGETSKDGGLSDVLRAAKARIVGRGACDRHYAGRGGVDRSMICAGAAACTGDQGGPLVLDGVLVGISSFGQGCAGRPGVYARIGSLRRWIDDHRS
jgi:trypsin